MLQKSKSQDVLIIIIIIIIIIFLEFALKLHVSIYVVGLDNLVIINFIIIVRSQFTFLKQ